MIFVCHAKWKDHGCLGNSLRYRVQQRYQQRIFQNFCYSLYLTFYRMVIIYKDFLAISKRLPSNPYAILNNLLLETQSLLVIYPLPFPFKSDLDVHYFPWIWILSVVYVYWDMYTGMGSNRGPGIIICLTLSSMIMCFCKYLLNIYHLLGKH